MLRITASSLAVVITLASVTHASAQQPAAKAVMPPSRQQQSVDPKAATIIERGIASTKKLETLEVISQLTLEGPNAAEHDQGTDTPARWVFDFRGAKDNAPFARVSIDSLKAGKVTRRVTFDGKTARSVDDAAKTFMTGTLSEVGDESTAMPGWFIDNRLGMAPVGTSPDDMDLPPLTAATIVGEEQLDGCTCDVVRSVRARTMPEFTGPDGSKIPAREMRIVEVVAYARTDGLARRSSMQVEVDGVPPDELIAVTKYTGVKANPKLDESVFATTAPDGYTQKAPRKQREQGGGGLKVATGASAPDFALKDLDGQAVTLASLKGRVVLLDFWATWCGPCKAAMPSIQKIHEDYSGKPVTVLGIDVFERKADAGPKYFREKGFTYGCLLEGEDLARAYGVTGIPTLVVIGKDGKVELIESGFGPEGDKNLRSAIDGALAK